MTDAEHAPNHWAHVKAACMQYPFIALTSFPLWCRNAEDENLITLTILLTNLVNNILPHSGGTVKQTSKGSVKANYLNCAYWQTFAYFVT